MGLISSLISDKNCTQLIIKVEFHTLLTHEGGRLNSLERDQLSGIDGTVAEMVGST